MYFKVHSKKIRKILIGNWSTIWSLITKLSKFNHSSKEADRFAAIARVGCRPRKLYKSLDFETS